MDRTQQCLTVAGFGVAFGARMVLADLGFALPRGGVTALLGPSGSGKSALVRTLAGLHEEHPRFRSWGSVTYDGRPLGEGPRPGLVQQAARVMGATVLDALAGPVRESLRLSPLELREWCASLVRRMGVPELAQSLDAMVLDLPPLQQRAVAILREAACEPPLLMVDEPTSNLSDYDAYVLLELLREVARTSTLLVVLHNQRHAAQLADHMLLLAGGRIQEARAMEDFLTAPQSEAGMQFVRTGSCSVPSLDADPDTLAEDVAPPPALQHVPASVLQAVAEAKAEPAPTLLASGIVPPAAQPVNAPLGFAWLEPGRIAGAPLPGAVNDIHHDLVALKRMGITMLITLTERDLPGDVLRQHGLANLHLPIYDHEVPTLAQIQMLLKRMEGLIQRGEVLAVHCLAGRGRTGVVLAAWWVRAGLTAQEALRRVRLIDPRYVQNAEQETFLQSYENMILQKIV